MLHEGAQVDDIFVVKFKKGFAPYANGFSFELTLSDNSGKNIEYKYWGQKDENKVRALYDSIKPDSIVRVQGKVGVYKERLQLTTNEPFLLEVLKEGEYNASDFLRKAEKDIEKMFSVLIDEINKIKNTQIKNLLQNIFNDESISTRFKTAPGSIEIHHNWIGGLLEHTLEVIEYCKKSIELFPELDRDLLIAGAILHDIGKMEELEVTTRIKGTIKGQMIGHLSLSAIFVSKKCDEIGMDDDIKNKLLHLIVSHHGRVEWGSPKEPMTAEAFALYYADELSSKLSGILNFIENSRETTEDDFMFHPRLGRNILLR